jgi:hypothetical protein
MILVVSDLTECDLAAAAAAGTFASGVALMTFDACASAALPGDVKPSSLRSSFFQQRASHAFLLRQRSEHHSFQC